MGWPINCVVARPSALFFRSFNSAHGHLVEVTPHLFFGAAQLPQVSLDLLDSRPALYFLECVQPVGLVVLFHGGCV